MSVETSEKIIVKPDYFKGDHWELPTDIGLINEAEKSFREKLLSAGWEENTDWLAICFSEALINAIVHGNLEIKEKSETEKWREVALKVQQEKPSTKKVFVTLNVTPEQISVTIRDEGSGFNVEKITDSTSKEAIFKSSGRGFSFMRNFFDSVTHNEKGNEVTMQKTKQKTA